MYRVHDEILPCNTLKESPSILFLSQNLHNRSHNALEKWNSMMEYNIERCIEKNIELL